MSKSLFVVRWLLVLCLFVGGAIACAQEQDEPGTPAGGPNDQDPQRGRGQRGVDRMLGMVPLLRVETVREEIGIDEEQSKTLETVTLQVREDFGAQMGEFLASLRDLSPEERRARRQEGDGRLSEIRAKINERLQGVLDESQFRRLKEIEVQRLVRTTGVGALTSEDVAAALDLTENQKQQLRDQAADSRGQGEALSLDDVRAQVKEVLTPEQLGKLDTLFGAAFDLPGELLERGRGRFGGRRGGRDGGRFGERRERPALESEEPASGEPNPE